MAVSSMSGRSLPRFEIGCDLWVHSETRPDRFIQFFKAAAAALKEQAEVKNVIEMHWQPIGPESPLITVLPAKMLLADDEATRGIGMHDQEGHRLAFAAKAVKEIPEELGPRLILHEFAHVHTYAELNLGIIDVQEKHQLEDAASDPAKQRELLEEFADSRLQKWGYPPKPLRDWCDEYFETLRLA